MPCADLLRLRQIARHFLYLTLELPEEGFGVRRRVEDQHARGLFRCTLKCVHRATRRVNEIAGFDELDSTVDLEPYFTFDDVVRLVPRMIVRRWSGILRQ